MKTLKRDYLSFFNLIDISSICINIYLLQGQWTDSDQNASKIILRIIAVSLMWVNLIYWLRVFEDITLYIRLIS